VLAAACVQKNMFSLRTGINALVSKSALAIAFKELATQAEVVTLWTNEGLIRLSAPVLRRQAGLNRPLRPLPERYRARSINNATPSFPRCNPIVI
jgi:hypothetical protein